MKFKTRSFWGFKVHLTKRLSKYLHSCKLILLRSIIQDTRSKLVFIERELFHLQISLGNLLSDFCTFDRSSWYRFDKFSAFHKFSLVKKLCNLNPPTPTLLPYLTEVNMNAIVYLSNLQLSFAQENSLKLNYTFTFSKRLKFPNLIAPVERCFMFSNL